MRLSQLVVEQEQTRLEMERQITQLSGQLEDALQAQETYASLVKRIQKDHHGTTASSPFSFGKAN